jgi:hypothetical protein
MDRCVGIYVGTENVSKSLNIYKSTLDDIKPRVYCFLKNIAKLNTPSFGPLTSTRLIFIDKVVLRAHYAVELTFIRNRIDYGT